MELEITWHGNVCRERRYKLDEYALIIICDGFAKEGNRIMMKIYTSREEGYRAIIRSFGLFTTGLNNDHYNHSAIFAEEKEYDNTCDFLDNWEHAERVQ